MAHYRIQCEFTIRNTDGNFMKRIYGDFQEIKEGHLLAAVNAAVESALDNMTPASCPSKIERKRTVTKTAKPPNHD